MTADEIISAVFGGLVLVFLVVLFIFMFKSAEKTEEKKRAFLEEITRYYQKRNEMFDKEDKD